MTTTPSARPAGRPDMNPSSVIEAADAHISVRPARLNRPLRQGLLDSGFTDPHLEEIIAAAATQARESARAQGYAAGWAQGRQAALEQAEREATLVAQRNAAHQAQVNQRMAEVLSHLAQATATADARATTEWAEVADVLAEGSIRLAESVLARELQSMDDATAESVRAALRQIADPSDAVIHLHPQDAALIGAAPDGVRIVPDPAVPAGSVVALTTAQRLRIDLPTALAAAQEVLRS